jgi:hypothetical protein|tara:strand:- start:185 stop:613 length:429 start_codon:yes stop_codon:yes gene_type:complete
MEQGMNRYTRLALNIGGMVALFFAGRFIYKKIKEKEILRNFGSLSNITNNNQGNSLGEQTADADYGILAKQLHELMDGFDYFNRNESKIVDLISQMDCKTRKAVETTFNNTYGNGLTLDTWLADDLGESNLAQARNLMNCSI